MNTARARKMRIWLEAALTAISIVTLALTLVAHDWIEQTIDASPDAGSGETEWLLTTAALAATLFFGSIATWERRLLRTDSV